MKSFHRLNLSELEELKNSVEWISNYPEKYKGTDYCEEDLCAFFKKYRAYICKEYNIANEDPAKVLFLIMINETPHNLWIFYSNYDWSKVRLKDGK